MAKEGSAGHPGEPGEKAVGTTGGRGGKGGEGGAGGTGEPKGTGGVGGGGGAGGRGATGRQGPPGPPGPQARWLRRGLLAWMVAFTLLVSYALRLQRDETRRTDARFCAVSTAFITSNQALRNAQNAASVKALGERQAVIDTDRKLLRIFTSTTMRLTASQRALRSIFVSYLNAEITLNNSLNISSIDSLNAANTAVSRWSQLKRELQC
jgi:hypothetical protein